MQDLSNRIWVLILVVLFISCSRKKQVTIDTFVSTISIYNYNLSEQKKEFANDSQLKEWSLIDEEKKEKIRIYSYPDTTYFSKLINPEYHTPCLLENTGLPNNFFSIPLENTFSKTLVVTKTLNYRFGYDKSRKLNLLQYRINSTSKQGRTTLVVSKEFTTFDLVSFFKWVENVDKEIKIEMKSF